MKTAALLLVGTAILCTACSNPEPVDIATVKADMAAFTERKVSLHNLIAASRNRHDNRNPC